MEYRLTLERVLGRDEDGMVSTHTVLEMTDTQELVATAGLATVAAVLGVAAVQVTPAAPAANPAAGLASTLGGPPPGVEKPARKPRKQAAPVASEPQPAAAPAPVAEAAPAPTEPQAPIAPVLDAGQPPRPVNPFATGG